MLLFFLLFTTNMVISAPYEDSSQNAAERTKEQMKSVNVLLQCLLSVRTRFYNPRHKTNYMSSLSCKKMYEAKQGLL